MGAHGKWRRETVTVHRSGWWGTAIWRIFHNINLVNIEHWPFDASNWSVFEPGLLGPVTFQSFSLHSQRKLQRWRLSISPPNSTPSSVMVRLWIFSAGCLFSKS